LATFPATRRRTASRDHMRSSTIFCENRTPVFPIMLSGATARAFALRRSAAGDRCVHQALNQMEHRESGRVVVDPVETLKQPQRVWLRQQVARGLLGRRLADRRGAVEQGRNRHAEDVGDLGESAGAHPVRALLVLLYLLECYADPPAELTLRQALLQSTDS